MLKKRELVPGDMNVTILGFGGIPISRVPEPEALRVIEHALEKGINYFDTARVYGDSEIKMGKVLKDVRDEVFISTKGIRRGKRETWEDIRTSLKNLQTESIDLYFVHDVSRESDFDAIFSPDGAIGAVKEAQKAGLIRHIGISGHRADLLIRLIETGEFEVVMVATNIADLEFQTTVIPRANELGIGTVAMKPFAGGALSDANIALRYSLVQPVTTTIPGMQSIEEVDENVAIAERSALPLTDEEREALEQEAKALGTRFCRQCGYCLPCAVEIDIPKVFLLDRYLTRYWLADYSRAEFRKLEVDPEECIECGVCEERCPYNLEIISMLKEARKRLAS